MHAFVIVSVPCMQRVLEECMKLSLDDYEIYLQY